MPSPTTMEARPYRLAAFVDQIGQQTDRRHLK
jgi:hypothetical protein